MMKLEDILRKSDATLEELEQEMRERDAVVNELRSENRYIRSLLEPMIVRAQREKLINSAGPGVTVGMGVTIGK